MLVRASIIIMALAATACAGEQPPADAPLSWATLKDGSHVAVGPLDPDTKETRFVTRCWKDAGRYDCLTVSGDEWRQARRTMVSALPTGAPSEKPIAGYECSIGSIGSGFQEQLQGPSGRLVSNVVARAPGPLQPGWSKAHVNQFLSDNGVKPKAAWFDCRNVANVIQEGSKASVASTALTYGMLDDKA